MTTNETLIRDPQGGANQSGLRDQNARVILSLIRRQGDVSSAEIARRSGLSAQTVSVPCFRELPEGNAVRGEDAEMHLSIDRRLGGEKGCFMVRAGQNDLALLGVEEGDFVLVSPTTVDEVENGSVVIARIGAESIFHRFQRNGRGVHLESLRSGVDGTHVEDPSKLRLIGRVTGFYRKMDESASVNLTQH